MDLAAALAARGAPSGTVVVAGYQEAGRGRAGRSWHAAPGESLLMSLVYRTPVPAASLGVLSPMLGLAVARSLDAWLPGAAQVKWPNDVLVRDRKVAGILVTARAGSPGETSLVIGIGLNVGSDAGSLPPGATSLALETGSNVQLEPVMNTVLASLSSLLPQVERGEIDPLLTALHRRLAFIGERVTVEEGGAVVAGTLRGVDRDGALLLESDSSAIQRIVAGDVVRGPRRDP